MPAGVAAIALAPCFGPPGSALLALVLTLWTFHAAIIARSSYLDTPAEELAAHPDAGMYHRTLILNELRHQYGGFNDEIAQQCVDRIFEIIPIDGYQLRILADWRDVEGTYQEAYDTLRAKSIRYRHLPYLCASAQIYMARMMERIRLPGASGIYAAVILGLEARVEQIPGLARHLQIARHFAEMNRRNFEARYPLYTGDTAQSDAAEPSRPILRRIPRR